MALLLPVIRTNKSIATIQQINVHYTHVLPIGSAMFPLSVKYIPTNVSGWAYIVARLLSYMTSFLPYMN